MQFFYDVCLGDYQFYANVLLLYFAVCLRSSLLYIFGKMSSKFFVVFSQSTKALLKPMLYKRETAAMKRLQENSEYKLREFGDER